MNLFMKKWNGGECPVNPGAMVKVKFRYGAKEKHLAARVFWGCLDWIGQCVAM
jgi:hypothetical protein